MIEIIDAATAASLRAEYPVIARSVADLVRDPERSDIEALRRARLLVNYRTGKQLPTRIAQVRADLLAFAIESEHRRALAWVAENGNGVRHLTSRFIRGALPGW